MPEKNYYTFEEMYTKKEKNKKIFIATYFALTIACISFLTYFSGQS